MNQDMRKHKMLFELIDLKETSFGGIGIKEFTSLCNDISKIAKKHGFEAYAKGYPQKIADYKPTGETFLIKTVEDISKLSPEQFEMFIEDLRNFCRVMKTVDALERVGLKSQKKDGMIWIDDGANESRVIIETNVSSKL